MTDVAFGAPPPGTNPVLFLVIFIAATAIYMRRPDAPPQEVAAADDATWCA